MRATSEEYLRLDLRAHSLLEQVPLHDTWSVDLPGGPAGLSIVDLRALLSLEKLSAANSVVRFFFALRARLGTIFGWDQEPAQASRESFILRLSAADRDGSLIAPGTPDGPFRALFVSSRESISEIQNATVHAFSVFALVEAEAGYRLYLAIYVRPIGRITAWYMRLIDPVRRFIIYPVLLRHVRTAWARANPESGRSDS